MTVHTCAQVLTAITAWCQHNDAAGAFPELFGAVRLQHLAPHELHACLQHGMLTAFPAALAHVQSALLNPDSADAAGNEEDTRRTVTPTPAKAARRLGVAQSPPHARVDTHACIMLRRWR